MLFILCALLIIHSNVLLQFSRSTIYLMTQTALPCVQCLLLHRENSSCQNLISPHGHDIHVVWHKGYLKNSMNYKYNTFGIKKYTIGRTHVSTIEEDDMGLGLL